jgi:hypothetical protein
LDDSAFAMFVLCVKFVEGPARDAKRVFTGLILASSCVIGLLS